MFVAFLSVAIPLGGGCSIFISWVPTSKPACADFATRRSGHGRHNPGPDVLPQDLVVEILSRLPAKSLCRIKCVSRSWRALISDPAHRRRFAQTLSGFFFFRRRPHRSTLPPLGFAGMFPSLPLIDDPSLSFLPSSWSKIEPLDSCNGLLLLRCSQQPSAGATGSPPPAFYVVCNPATGEWVALPQPSVEPGQDGKTRTNSAVLGFDPAVSSHFHVFQLVEEYYGCYSMDNG